MTTEQKSPLSKGPYVSIEQDEVYLPVEHWSYNEARSEAADWAQTFIDTWGRSRYKGKKYVPLHDHDDWEYCEDCPDVLVWEFEIYEGTAKSESEWRKHLRKS